MTDVQTTRFPSNGLPQAEATRAGRFYLPPCDIIEKDDELLLLADVPGVRKDEIDIRFEDGTLTIHAAVAPRHSEQKYVLREYGVGDFYRTFQVSEAVDASRISADYADGVLALHLPMAEAVKPRKIAVNAR